MKFLVLIAIAIAVPVSYSQTIDKPATPEDLSSQFSDEKTRFDGEMRFLDRVTSALRESAKETAEPAKLAAVVHAEVTGCLTKGDHERAVGRLYGRAAVEAGRTAADWESRSKAASAPAGSDSQREFSTQMKEAESRLMDLQHKVPLTPEDRDEITALSARISQLQGVLTLFDQVTKQADPSRYAKAAAALRQKELIFQRQAEGASLQAAAEDMECRAGLFALRSLKEQEDIQKQLGGWQILQ